jgi:hypothetical protein
MLDCGLCVRVLAACCDCCLLFMSHYKLIHRYMHGHPFTPFSEETHGRLGKPAIALLARLGVEAVGAARLGAVSLPLCGRRLGNLA